MKYWLHYIGKQVVHAWKHLDALELFKSISILCTLLCLWSVHSLSTQFSVVTLVQYSALVFLLLPPPPLPRSLQVYRSNDQCKEYLFEFVRKTEELLHSPTQLAVEIKNFVSK